MSDASIYTVGGTVQAGGGLYIPRKADDELLELCRAGTFAYILTARQMGKSSLIVRTMERLQEAGAQTAFIDLSQMGVQLTAEQWYLGLLITIADQLMLETDVMNWWEERAHLGITQRLTSFFQEVLIAETAGPVVIFIDEIDTTLSLPFTDDFFAAIRYLYNARANVSELRRLSFVLVGVASPTDLVTDVHRTPFNIGRRIDLEDFSERDVAPLAAGLGRSDPLAAVLLRRILYWSGGHPFLTQRLCQAVSQNEEVTSSAGVDRLCEQLFFTPRARERDDNLQFVRDRLLGGDVDIASLLDLYSRVRSGQSVPDDRTDPLVGRLRLSGIIRVEDGHLRVRNKVYDRVFDREWVATQMPGAELRRQQVAFRSGLQRGAVLALIAIMMCSALIVASFRLKERSKADAERDASKPSASAPGRTPAGPRVVFAPERFVKHTPRWPLHEEYFQTLSAGSLHETYPYFEQMLHPLVNIGLRVTEIMAALMTIWFLRRPIEVFIENRLFGGRKSAPMLWLYHYTNFVFDRPVDFARFKKLGEWIVVFFLRSPALVLIFSAANKAFVMPSYPLESSTVAAFRFVQVVIALGILTQTLLPICGALIIGILLYLMFAYDWKIVSDVFPVLTIAVVYMGAPWDSWNRTITTIPPRQMVLVRRILGFSFFVLGWMKLYNAYLTVGIADQFPKVLGDPFVWLFWNGADGDLTRENWVAAFGLAQVLTGFLVMMGIFCRVWSIVTVYLFTKLALIDFGWEGIPHLFPIAALLVVMFTGNLINEFDRMDAAVENAMEKGRLGWAHVGSATGIATLVAFATVFGGLLLITNVPPIPSPFVASTRPPQPQPWPDIRNDLEDEGTEVRIPALPRWRIGGGSED